MKNLFALQLWPDQTFPQWDAEKLYELFLKKISGGLSPAETTEFCLLTMIFTSMYFGRMGLIKKLDSIGLGASDVAQEIVTFIEARCDRFKLRGVGYKVLLASLNTTIHHKVSDAIARARQNLPLDDLEQCLAGPADAPPLSMLESHLREPETRAACCAGLHPTAGQIYDRQVGALMRGNLPDEPKIDPAIHGLVTTRLVRRVREFAAAA